MTFKPWTFQPQPFLPWTYKPHGSKIHDGKVWGLKVHSWKVLGWDVLQPKLFMANLNFKLRVKNQRKQSHSYLINFWNWLNMTAFIVSEFFSCWYIKLRLVSNIVFGQNTIVLIIVEHWAALWMYVCVSSDSYNNVTQPTAADWIRLD